MPEGYHVVRSPTFSLWVLWRTFLENGDPKPGVDLVKKFTKIYPLSDAGATHPPLNFVDVSGKPFNTLNPTGYQFWELLNKVVQQEPTASLDPIQLGFFQSIGIEKGKPFAPDAAHEENSELKRRRWGMPLLVRCSSILATRPPTTIPTAIGNCGFLGGYQFQTQPGVLNFDAATFYYTLAILVTPAMEDQGDRQGLAVCLDCA